MSKVAVIYWSGTGNTEAMAYAIAEGAKTAGQRLTNNAPDDAALTACKALGAAIA